MLDKAPHYESVGGTGGKALPILKLGTRWICQFHEPPALSPGIQPSIGTEGGEGGRRSDPDILEERYTSCLTAVGCRNSLQD